MFASSKQHPRSQHPRSRRPHTPPASDATSLWSHGPARPALEQARELANMFTLQDSRPLRSFSALRGRRSMPAHGMAIELENMFAAKQAALRPNLERIKLSQGDGVYGGLNLFTKRRQAGTLCAAKTRTWRGCAPGQLNFKTSRALGQREGFAPTEFRSRSPVNLKTCLQ